MSQSVAVTAKSVTAYVCTVVLAGHAHLTRLVPAASDEEAIAIGCQHVAFLREAGFGQGDLEILFYEVAREVHTLDEKRGITVARLLLARDGVAAVDGVVPQTKEAP